MRSPVGSFSYERFCTKTRFEAEAQGETIPLCILARNFPPLTKRLIQTARFHTDNVVLVFLIGSLLEFGFSGVSNNQSGPLQGIRATTAGMLDHQTTKGRSLCSNLEARQTIADIRFHYHEAAWNISTPI